MTHVSPYRPATILKALLMGMKIEVGKRIYQMDIDYRLCEVRQREDGSDILLVVDFGDGVTLSAFVCWCALVTDDEMTIIGSNIVLNEL